MLAWINFAGEEGDKQRGMSTRGNESKIGPSRTLNFKSQFLQSA